MWNEDQHVSGSRRSTRLAATQKQISAKQSAATLLHWDEPPDPGVVNSFVEKAPAALKSGLAELQPDTSCRPPYQTTGTSKPVSGYWGQLPEELLENILSLCQPTQLGMLQTTCTYFNNLKLIDSIAKQKLNLVPRTRGLKPNKRYKESNLTLLHFVTCQSAAAAQATAVSCGAYHTAGLMIPSEAENVSPSSSALTSRHKLYSFGRGFHGQLGTGSFIDQKSPVNISLGYRAIQDNAKYEEETMPVVVTCGSHNAAAISRQGELFMWGLCSNGELGQGRWTPVEVNTPRPSFLPRVRIVSVTCGANHTLAIGEAGSLWSSGKNYHGQLGLGNLVESFRLQMVQNLQGYRIVSAAAGAAHSMALASDGSLFTWGDGGSGQLGHSQLQQVAALVPGNNAITMPLPQKVSRLDPAILEPGKRVTAISAGNYHSMVMTVGGGLLAFGGNSHGCLGLGDTDIRWKPTKVQLSLAHEDRHRLRVVQLVCGAAHSVALISNMGSLEVRTTGCNMWGQLGQGDKQDRHVFTPTVHIPGPVAVQAGEHHSIAITTNRRLYVWGRGDSGQLGLGDARARWKPTMMKGFTVVHTDKTLRRNKRSQPLTREVEEPPAKRLKDSPIDFSWLI